MIEWKRDEGSNRGPPILYGKVGKIKMFSIYYDLLSKGDESTRYIARTLLPGFRAGLDYKRVGSEDLGKSWCDAVLKKWLAAAGLQHA